MENHLTRAIYDHSPLLLQNLFTSAYGLKKRLWRYGPGQREREEFFRRSAKWSFAELQAYQDEKVREVVREAYENVPFWRDRMVGLSLKPTDIRAVADLPKLPLLKKSDIRQAGDRMLSRAVPRKRLFRALTSGSTGYPLTLHWIQETDEFEYGFHWARRRPHCKRGDSYGSFAGLRLQPLGRMKPPFWRYNWAARQTCYSVYHVSPQTIPYYLEELARQKHVFLEGYPSVIATLAKCVLDAGRQWPCPPRAVFSVSEELQDQHRKWIEQGFRTRVYNLYGQGEKACSITEYDCGHLHYDMDYGVIEFLPYDRDPDGQVAEIVCTGFANPAWPLIRYQVGDLVLLPDEPVECDLFPTQVVMRIYGRTGHALIARDGRQINNVSCVVTRTQSPNIEAVQCIQYEPGQVEMHVVRGPNYTDVDENKLLENFHSRIAEMDCEIVYVDDVERSRNGKFLSIINRIPKDNQS